jgi:serine/threonine-protein kinase RsbT
MTTTQESTELAKLPIARVQDVLMARLVVRGEAIRLGFCPKSLTQIATAVSEISRNVVQHSGAAGQIRVSEVTENGRRALRIAVEDTGSGIRDLDHVLAGASAGAGIPGCRKIMDEFSIQSKAGRGTIVVMAKWLPDS